MTASKRVLILLILCSTGCAGSLYNWMVQTASSPLLSDHRSLGQEQVAVFTPLTSPALRGNESGLSQYLGEVLKKMAPNWNVLDEQHTINLINSHGLAAEYARMRTEAEQTHILDRDTLQQLGKSTGARYVFQPRLAYFSQTMTDRWTIGGLGILISQIRSCLLRLSLQLWDMKSGELVWVSVAETTLQNEAVSQEPVFLKDAVLVTFGGMVEDLLNGKTSSKYTPLNVLLDSLTRGSVSKQEVGADPK